MDEPLPSVELDFIEAFVDLVEGQSTILTSSFDLVVEVCSEVARGDLVEGSLSILVCFHHLLEAIWGLLPQLYGNARRTAH